jgi:hypothetical protein
MAGHAERMLDDRGAGCVGFSGYCHGMPPEFL